MKFYSIFILIIIIQFENRVENNEDFLKCSKLEQTLKHKRTLKKNINSEWKELRRNFWNKLEMEWEEARKENLEVVEGNVKEFTEEAERKKL